MKDGKVVDAELEVIGQSLILRTSYCDDSLRGKGVLAKEGKYRVRSDRYTNVNNMILHLPGNEKDRDNWVCIYRFDSPHNAHRAKTAFEALIDKINAEHAEPEKPGVPETAMFVDQVYRLAKIHPGHVDNHQLYFDSDVGPHGESPLWMVCGSPDFAGYYYDWTDDSGNKHTMLRSESVIYVNKSGSDYSYSAICDCIVPLRPVAVAFTKGEA